MRRTRTSTARQRPALRRLVLAVFALALSGVHFFGLGHLVFVTHVLCEHGALLHAEDVAHVEEQAPAGTDAAAPGSGEHHQHCDVLAVKTTTLAVQPPFAAPAPISWLLAADAVSPAPAHPPIGLLALAPKASPPSARPFA
jgi:hypothetical protein